LLSNEFSLSEYTIINVGWGFAPDPTGGAYSAPQTCYSCFQGGRFAAEGNRGDGKERLGEGKRGR